MAWDAFASSELLTCDANFEAFHNGTDAIIISTTPREFVDFNFTIASEVGEVDDLEIQILGGNRVVSASAILASSTDTLIGLASGQTEADDYYMGMYLAMTQGGETKDIREISDYIKTGGTVEDQCTLVRALSGTPSTAEQCSIFHMRPVSQFIIKAETTLTEDLPQNGGVLLVGHPYYIARARSTGGTDAHIALMTYTPDGVSA